jgi:hypothetical protein
LPGIIIWRFRSHRLIVGPARISGTASGGIAKQRVNQQQGAARMRSNLMAGLSLLIGITATPMTGFAKYSPLPTPIASTVLVIDGQTHALAILDQNNVAIHLLPAEYQDMDITKAFDIECILPGNNRQLVVAARIDSRYHMIPIDVIVYKEYDPSYIKLGIDTIYLRNAIDNSDFSDHKIYIDFYARGDRPI